MSEGFYYIDKVEKLQATLSASPIAEGMEDIPAEKPSTGNPGDYVGVTDLEDIGKGKHVVFKNREMPESASDALKEVLHGLSHKSCEDRVEPNKLIFLEVMGFSVEDLFRAADSVRESLKGVSA